MLSFCTPLLALWGAGGGPIRENTLFAELPFVTDMDPDQVVCVETTVDGSPKTRTMFDSFADAIIVTSSFAKQLGLTTHDSVDLKTPTGDAASGKAVTLKSWGFGGAPMANVPALAFDMPDYFPFEAVLGSPAFEFFAVRVDEKLRKLDLFAGSTYKYDGDGTALPASFDHGHAIVSATVDGIPGRFILDTGMDAAMTLNATFVAQHHLRKPGMKFLRSCYEGAAGFGFEDTTRLSTIEIGGCKLSNPVVDFDTDPKEDSADADGVIGIEVLHRFNFVFDANSHQVILEKLPAVSEPFLADRVGFTCNVVKGRFTVAYVEPGSPAETAGVKVGDILLEEDGKPQRPADMYRSKRLNRGPVGAKTVMVLERGGRQIKVEVTLRKLI